MTDEHNRKHTGQAPSTPEDENSAYTAEVGNVRCHRRWLTEVDDSLLISGTIRLGRDNEQVFRFLWDNLATYWHERLKLFVQGVPDIWLEEVEDGVTIMDEYVSEHHPLLGFIPMTVTENVLHNCSELFREDLHIMLSSRLHGKWTGSKYSDYVVWDDVSFEGLIQAEDLV